MNLPLRTHDFNDWIRRAALVINNLSLGVVALGSGAFTLDGGDASGGGSFSFDGGGA